MSYIPIEVLKRVGVEDGTDVINSKVDKGDERVYHLTSFCIEKEYEMAISFRRQGTYPHYQYFTSKPLMYVGKYVRYLSIEYGEDAGGVEIFVNKKGKEIRIPWDFEFRCYREIESCE